VAGIKLPVHTMKNPKRTLDQVFSKYVRFSNAKNGYVRCYTCNAVHPPEDVDAGHYVTRQHMGTRWDERNVKPQCRSCNRFKSGVSDEFALHLLKDYGEGILEDLNKHKWIPTKITELEMMEMIKDYREKLKVL